MYIHAHWSLYKHTAARTLIFCSITIRCTCRVYTISHAQECLCLTRSCLRHTRVSSPVCPSVSSATELAAACLRATTEHSCDLFTCKSVQQSSACEENRSWSRSLQIPINEPTGSRNRHVSSRLCDLFITLHLDNPSSSSKYWSCQKDGGLTDNRSTG